MSRQLFLTRRRIVLILIIMLPPRLSVSQATDKKVAIYNQIRYLQAIQEQDKGSILNAGIESYKSIRDAKAYLKSQGIPNFASGDKNLEALATAVYGGKLAEREARAAYIDRLQLQLHDLNQRSVVGGQPLPPAAKTEIETLVTALKVQSDLERQAAQKQINSNQLQRQLQYQLQFQAQTEQAQKAVQQRTQPLSPQQTTAVNMLVQQIKQQSQQQQQQNQQQNQQIQQMQQQQQTQPMNQQQQQMVNQLVQALQSQIQQGQVNQQTYQLQQQQAQQLH